MIRKNTIACMGLIAVLALNVESARAQDVHFTQFNAAPLIVNPAFTGNFSGQWRAAAIYRDQWRSIPAPFVTYGASLDMPLVQDLTIDDYLAGGIQLYNDKAGDGNLSNFTGMLSLAYHKFLGRAQDPNMSLSVGFQGGYTSKSIDLSKLYFEEEYYNGEFLPGTGIDRLNLNNKTNYWIVNAGIGWSHSLGERFGYAIGLGANNLNQPRESFRKQENSEVGLGIRYTGQVGAIAYVSDKFSLRPAVLYQTQATAYELVAGNEFHCIVGDPEVRSMATAIFLGGWYRNNDAAMVSAGVEFKGMRIGVSYDYTISDLQGATNGNGGFEISLRYIAPNPLDFARRLVYPCSRF
jgi:type IX secretion system PorP/SprF family membrane protein